MKRKYIALFFAGMFILSGCEKMKGNIEDKNTKDELKEYSRVYYVGEPKIDDFLGWISKSNYCMDLRLLEKRAVLYFPLDSRKIELKVENVKKNKFRLIYNGEKREFYLYKEKYVAREASYFILFDDIKKYDPQMGKIDLSSFGYDGYDFGGTVDECLEYIKIQEYTSIEGVEGQ